MDLSTEFRSATPDPEVDPARVLVVDDRPEQIVALLAVLEDVCGHVDVASSGRDALRKLLEHDYAVVLLDVNMPMMDGYETASMIRQRPRSEHTPIIFVTAASPSEATQQRGYQLGAVDYLFTPVIAEALRAKVSVFVELYRKTQQVRRQAEWLRSEAERRAAQLESRLRQLLDDLAVGVFRAHPDGRLVAANPAMLALLGVPSLDQASTEGFTANFALPHGEELPRPLTALNDLPGFRTTEVEVRRPDGTTLWCSLQRRLVRDPGGAVFVDGLLEDVTERKLAVEAMAKKAEELSRANAELEHFAYIASHDLQEPLRTIQLYAGLLARKHGRSLDDDGRGCVDTVGGAARRMQELVRDVLAFHRLRLGERAVSEFELDELLDRALFNLENAIRQSGAVVTRGALPTVSVDAVLIVQLFQNLVGNALKFRGPESPVIHVDARPSDDGGWEISVADNGIGIDPAYKEQVFAIFRRLHTTERYEGTGVGLAICRHIVERHHGRIWFESEVGRGTTFRFTLR